MIIIDKIMQVIEDVMIDAEVDYPAGYGAGERITYDDDKIRAALTAAFAAMSEPVVKSSGNMPLIQALSRMAGNRQSDGTSSLVSRDDRETILNWCHDMLLASRSVTEPSPDLAAENERLRAALTPSAETRTAYIGEFSFLRTSADEHGNERYERITVPWTTVKDIMKAIREHAALERT